MSLRRVIPEWYERTLATELGLGNNALLTQYIVRIVSILMCNAHDVR
jgi:hypothetical protein